MKCELISSHLTFKPPAFHGSSCLELSVFDFGCFVATNDDANRGAGFPRSCCEDRSCLSATILQDHYLKPQTLKLCAPYNILRLPGGGLQICNPVSSASRATPCCHRLCQAFSPNCLRALKPNMLQPYDPTRPLKNLNPRPNPKYIYIYTFNTHIYRLSISLNPKPPPI